MRAVKHFLIEAKETHKEKEGGIILLERFENQSKANQVFLVHSIPQENKLNVEIGDSLIIHFNIVTYDYDGSEKKLSKYNIADDIYYVPDNMIHGVIKKNGDIEMTEENNLIKPIIKKEEVTSSGIIFNLNNDKMALKKNMMSGKVYASNILNKWDKVIMENYSDYEIDIPKVGVLWMVRDSMILAVDED